MITGRCDMSQQGIHDVIDVSDDDMTNPVPEYVFDSDEFDEEQHDIEMAASDLQAIADAEAALDARSAKRVKPASEGTRKSARIQKKEPAPSTDLDWTAMGSLLKKEHRRAVECGNKGNCFFDSVVYALDPSTYDRLSKRGRQKAIDNAAWLLRQRVSKWMGDERNLPTLIEYSGADHAVYSDGQEKWSDYAKYIGQDKAWINGNVEIVVTSLLLDRVIDVYSYRSVPGKDGSTLVLNHLPHGKGNGPPIEIAIIDESHYRAVVPE